MDDKQFVNKEEQFQPQPSGREKPLLLERFQLVEKVFSTSCLRFQNFQKVLKSIDLNGAGHPSWVPRAHPSFPFSYISGFIDSLRDTDFKSLCLFFLFMVPLSAVPGGLPPASVPG